MPGDHQGNMSCMLSAYSPLLSEWGSSPVGIPWTQSIFQVQMQILYQ